MKMISSREFTAHPGKVWQDLEKEGSLVVTKDGKPCSILLPTSDETLMEDLQELVFARARRAVKNTREQAAETEAQKVSMEDIDAEIQRLRKDRHPD